MNTEFSYPQGRLQLYRWPLQQPNINLQAWDAADELLIQHAFVNINRYQQQYNNEPRLLLLNDSFGALSCALSAYSQVQITDSLLAQQATLYNRQQNNLTINNLHQQSSLEPYPTDCAIVLLKLPANHSYLRYMLRQLAQVVTPQTCILATGKAKDINQNLLQIFTEELGPATASLCIKKCRLIECQPELPPKSPTQIFPIRWAMDDTGLTIVNHANVFSREKADIGARFLVQHLPHAQPGQQVIDLGCGNGILGLSLLMQQPEAKVLFCDESYMAVDSSRLTVQENLPASLSQCQFVIDDCLKKQPAASADWILCNPPFHQQQAITSHIASQMFQDAKRVLRQGGHLRVVANRHLPYTAQLKALFGNCRMLAGNAKFVILDVVKRS